ncbi:hypothetical protein Gotri_021167, partial [Gossypium trilobum]|nr:hypothetical protein [Gossypium trilobum]
MPGFLLALGMQFTVESPRWLCRVGDMKDAQTIIRNLWGDSEVDKAIEEFQSIICNDGTDVNSRWMQLLEEPHSRGCIKFAGINGVLYFSSLTFQDVGIASGALASLFVGLTNFA